MRYIILNADDFGSAPAANAAIVRAHTEGVLTSTSLMVAEPAAPEAVGLARAHPSLAVGLHLTLSDGSPALPAADVPHLVGRDGRLRASPALAGLACFFSPGARREVAREVAAQFEQFAATGLTCDHVNGHQHLHLHPIVWDALVRHAADIGAPYVRIPNEEFVLASRGRTGGRRAEWLFWRALRRRCLRSLLVHGLAAADRVYGHLETGGMDEAYVLGLLGRLQGSTNEVYFHPGTPHARRLPCGAGDMDVDLHALLSPRVRQRIDELGLSATTHGRLP